MTIELSFTDDVSLLGVKPVGAGDDNDPNLIIPQIKQRIGGYTSVGTRESPNVAVIAGLKPDLILADVIGNAKIMTQLRQIAPTIALQSQHTTYQQNLDAAVNVGVAMFVFVSKHPASRSARAVYHRQACPANLGEQKLGDSSCLRVLQ